MLGRGYAGELGCSRDMLLLNACLRGDCLGTDHMIYWVFNGAGMEKD